MQINTNLKDYKFQNYPNFANSKIIKMKSIRTLFFSFIISISYNYVFATTNNTITPDYNYDMVISDSHPLTRDEIKNDIKYRKPSGYLSFGSQNSVDSSKLSSPTYTYVRCYYKYSPNNSVYTYTSYEWAVNTDGSYYKLFGYWSDDSIFAWKNMFYTDTLQQDIKAVCDNTMKYKKIFTPSFYFVAANNQLSFNQTIWTNDDSSEIHRNYITKIIIFGDSLSDINNMYNISQWQLPNSSSYFQGRFSNGKNWVEYLADTYNLPFYDWAIGGAAGNMSQYGILPGLKQEVQSWQNYMQVAKNYQPANSLFTILIGANDFVNYSRSVDDVINDVNDSINNIYNSGGRNILILNLPDVTQTPIFNNIDGGKQAQKAEVKRKVIEYNSRLSDLINSLKSKLPSSNIQLFDTFDIFNKLVTNPNIYNLSNVTNSCLLINSDNPLNYTTSHILRSYCNPDTFMFWDTLHPTTTTHKLLANEVATFVKNKFNFAEVTH